MERGAGGEVVDLWGGGLELEIVVQPKIEDRTGDEEAERAEGEEPQGLEGFSVEVGFGGGGDGEGSPERGGGVVGLEGW